MTELSNCCDNGWVGTTYEYNANGNLTYASNWTFYYNSDNRLRQIGRPASEFTEDYTYNEFGQLSSVTSKHFGNGGPTTTCSYTYTYPNSTTHNFSQVVYGNGAVETVEYDNNPNPFKYNWLQLGAAYFLYWDRPCYQTDNNIIKSTYTEGTTKTITTNVYKYNELGYPIIIETEIHTTTLSDTTTIISPPYAIAYACQ